VDGPETPDPSTAADIPEFVDRLAALWEWAGSPGYRGKFQEMANQRLGGGAPVGHDDVRFRICLTYTPELAPRVPVVHCAERY
jgi:hypothetical protein